MIALAALAALAGPADLELVDAGSAPHAVYRYAPNPGDTQKIRLEMEVGMEMSLGGMAMPGTAAPTVFYELEAKVGGVTPDSVPWVYSITKAGAVGDSPVAGQLNTEMAGMVGTTGDVVLTRRGLPAPGATSADPAAEQLDVGAALGKITMQLPEAAIGVGASWRRSEDVLEGGIAVHQESTWTLAEVRKDGALVIDLTVAQSAEPQEMGEGKKLLAFSSASSGRTVVHPGKIVPLSVEVSGKTELSAETSMGGAPMTVDTKLSQTTRLTEK